MKTIDEKYIDELISKVENITDLECYNDDIDLEADEIELYFGCEGELGILLSDEEPEKFSIFTCFSYRDFKRYEFEESLYEPEEIELEKRTFLEENLFRLILKKADFPYALTVTDDGNFMCPGYVSWIGFFNIPYSEKVIYDFNIFIKRFYQKICNLDDVQMMQEIIKLICKENDIDTNINDNTMFICNSCLEFNCEKPDFFECVEEKYFGQEYFLFKVDGKTFFTEVKPIELFISICEKCILFDEPKYFYYDNKLYIKSDAMIFSQSATVDNGVYANIEEKNLLMRSSSFVPFSSEKFKNTFFENFAQMMGSSGNEPLIITEGTTDWIHLKKHWQLLKNKFRNIDISFWEYYPFSEQFSDKQQQTMGGPVLLEMCKAYSKLAQSRLYIFIADSDDKHIVKEMGGGDCFYKKWNTNVYSMILPIPKHRVNAHEICIEHLYDDEEIKQEFLCSDGVKRHLYLGKDFDEYGRGIIEQKLCLKRNWCGSNSIKIIDGSSDCRVISLDSKDKRNYALSKFGFAEKINPNPQSVSFEAFSRVFEIIKEIIDDRYR